MQSNRRAAIGQLFGDDFANNLIDANWIVVFNSCVATGDKKLAASADNAMGLELALVFGKHDVADPKA